MTLNSHPTRHGHHALSSSYDQLRQTHARVARVLVQVWRWAQQYRTQLLGEPMPEMVSLIDWLQSHIPAEDADPTVTRISHGDFRCAAMSQHHMTCDQ